METHKWEKYMKKQTWNKVFIGTGVFAATIFGCSKYLSKNEEALTEQIKTESKISLQGIIVPVNLDSIYNFLKKNYPSYEGITYSAPTTNILRENNWLLQTPNIWGFDLSSYNTVFGGSNLDACYNLPTCNTDSDCQGGDSNFPASCVVPNFVTEETIGCPNSGSTPAGQKLCLSNAHKIITNLYNDIINAQSTIDISMLNTGANFLTEQQFAGDPTTQVIGASNTPDAFFFTIKQALTVLSNTNREVTIRLLGGSYNGSTATQIDAKSFLTALTANFNPNNKLSIVVAPERSCPTITFEGSFCDNPYASSNDMFKGSWNHGKNIVIDQTIVYAGGENLWGGDYLTSNPTNDGYLRIEGPVAKGATIYNDKLFTYLSSILSLGEFANGCIVYADNQVYVPDPLPTTCHGWETSPNLVTSVTPNAGDLSVSSMYISKLNGGIVSDSGNTDADESEPARVFAISNASQSVKIVQQSLFIKGWTYNGGQPTTDGTIWPANPNSTTAPNPIATMDAIAKVFLNNIQLKRNVPVSILTTSYSQYDGYGSDVELSYIYKFLCRELITTYGQSAATAQAQLSQNLKLGYVSYKQEETFNGSPGHHNKFWMVDDHIFYFGSHNFYPSSLQQFGIITDNSNAAAIVNSEFWNNLWSNADTSTDAFDPSQVNCNNLNG